MKPRDPGTVLQHYHRNPLDPLGRASAQQQQQRPTAAPQQQPQEPLTAEELGLTGLAAFVKQYQHVIFLATVVVVLLCILLLMRLATRSVFRRIWGLFAMLRQKIGGSPQAPDEKKFV